MFRYTGRLLAVVLFSSLFLFLTFPSFLSFSLFFSFRLSSLLGFANLKRNRFSPDYLDPRGGPSEVSRPSPAALPTLGEGLAPGRGLSPRLIYLGHATPLFVIRIQPENSSQLGRGRGICCQTGEGVWGLSRALLPEELRDPRTLITIRLYSRKLRLIVLSFYKAPGCSSDVSERKRTQRLT